MKVSDFSEFMKAGKTRSSDRNRRRFNVASCEVLASMGLNITGSDISDSDTVKMLRQKGFDIRIGHYPENIEGAEFIVRTAAVHDSNPEIIAAENKGIPYSKGRRPGAQ
jgi:UDP-N-acetylmuramate--alanine ligase